MANIGLHISAVGDVAALTAAIREYRRTFPDETITLEGVGRQAFFIGNPHVGVRRNESGKRYRLRVPMDDDAGSIPRSFAKQLGIPMVDDTPELFLLDRERKKAAQLMDLDGPVVAIDPWSQWPSRRWAFGRYAMLASELQALGWKVIEIGARTADPFGNVEDRRIPNVDARIIDSVSIRVAAAILERCALFIGNDSGLSHVAAAVGTPQVVIYSVVRWWRRAYWNTTPVFRAKLCPKVCVTSCRSSTFCMDDISVQDVLSAVSLAARRFCPGRPCSGDSGVIESSTEIPTGREPWPRT